jgi:signal transduction histidine kinase
MTSIADHLIYYLENNIPMFIDCWREKAIITEFDIHTEEVVENGLKMFELVKKTIRNPLTDDEIKVLAYKVAKERAEADVNIGDFVYNVNTGRSEILDWVMTSGIPVEHLQAHLKEINILFDKFSHYAVRRYTEIKEEHLQEKDDFINETHKERLTILGQMSSSFVHEFRNPLTAVMGFIKLMENEYPNIKYLDIISHELDQLNYRISQFLHVSRKEVIARNIEEFSLIGLMDDLVQFLYPSIVDNDVEIIKNIDPTIRISGNRDEFRQVFLNIIINSIDALQLVKQERQIAINGRVVDGKIEILLSNNGPVIDKDKIATIFEPFFTTKELGTGIGLYVCKKLIANHGGEIDCTSDEKSTTFSITVPRVVTEQGELIETVR